MTAITPDTLKSVDEMTAITPKTGKIGKNDEMTVITPLGPKIAQCYSHPPPVIINLDQKSFENMFEDFIFFPREMKFVLISFLLTGVNSFSIEI